MAEQSPTNITVLENTDFDNMALAHITTDPVIDTQLIVVDGRPVYLPDGELDTVRSEQIMRLNTARMAGYLRRLGRSTLICTGQIPPYSPVPPEKHFDEKEFDLHGDEDLFEEYGIGTLADATRYLKETSGPINVISGGAMTDIAYWLQDPEIASRFGYLTAQIGTHISSGIDSTHIEGENHQFNTACDPEAARNVFRDYPGSIYALTKNTTKYPSQGFASANEIAALGLPDELVKNYQLGFEYLRNKRDGLVYMHDVHPGFIMDTLINAPETVRPFSRYISVIRGYTYRPLQNSELVFGAVETYDGSEEIISTKSLRVDEIAGPRYLVIQTPTLPNPFRDTVRFLGTDEARQSVETQDGRVLPLGPNSHLDNKTAERMQLRLEFIDKATSTSDLPIDEHDRLVKQHVDEYVGKLAELDAAELADRQLEPLADAKRKDDVLGTCTNYTEFYIESVQHPSEGLIADDVLRIIQHRAKLTNEELELLQSDQVEENRDLTQLCASLIMGKDYERYAPLLDSVQLLEKSGISQPEVIEKVVSQIFVSIFSRLQLTADRATQLIQYRGKWTRYLLAQHS